MSSFHSIGPSGQVYSLIIVVLYSFVYGYYTDHFKNVYLLSVISSYEIDHTLLVNLVKTFSMQSCNTYNNRYTNDI